MNEKILKKDEEKQIKRPSKFGVFMKKNGFYLGIFFLMLLVVLVISSDNTKTTTGSIEYNEKAFYTEGNKLYIKDREKEPVLLTANLMEEFSSTKKSHILLMCKSSEDQKIIYYFENVRVLEQLYIGDLMVYKNNKKKKIGHNVPLSYALSSDLEKVVFVEGVEDTKKGGFTYSLNKYVNKKKTLIAEGVDKDCFTLSGDGNTIFYNQGFYVDTATTGMYMYKDGINTSIDNQVVYYYKLNANGTYKSNWPLTNYDGSKVIYATYAGENTLPSLKMYTVSDNKSHLLSENFEQVFVDEKLNKAVINGEVKGALQIGNFIKVDLNTMKSEIYAKDIWGLIYMDIAKYVDDSFFDINFYYKNFNPETTTADLYFKGEGQTEAKVLSSVYVDDVKFTKDNKNIYALGYYYKEEGGDLTVFSDITKTSYKSNQIDEQVSEYHFDDANSVLGYRKDVKLYVIDTNGSKKMIDNHSVKSFDITKNGQLIYFFKETTIGKGELYVKEINSKKDYKLIDKGTTFVYGFEDKYIAYITAFDFGTESGTLILSDGMNSSEVIVEYASTLLNGNYIK